MLAAARPVCYTLGRMTDGETTQGALPAVNLGASLAVEEDEEPEMCVACGSELDPGSRLPWCMDCDGDQVA